jgi:hypothetical protein
MRFGARLDQIELLDRGCGTLQDVTANLAEMARLNRWLGGYRALARHLYPRLLACTAPACLLDLGTGNADLPLHILAWAKRRGIALSAWGLDWAPRNLSVAAGAVGRRPGLRLLRADARRLPLPAGGADFVISSLFMHHFGPEELVSLLRAAFGAARQSLIMSDLIRSRGAYAAFRMLPSCLAGNFLTRHDGALSIRRAYSPAELVMLAKAAGLTGAEVYVHWPWRMTLAVDK